MDICNDSGRERGGIPPPDIQSYAKATVILNEAAA
jgi:hypothetical protein